MNYPFPQMAIIARQKLTGLGDHWGVLQMDGTVFDITQEHGMRVTSHREFAAGKESRVVHLIPIEHVHAANSRIYQEMSSPKPYHVLENNCEIVANRVAGKPAVSPQVIFWTIAAFLVGAAWLAKR